MVVVVVVVVVVVSLVKIDRFTQEPDYPSECENGTLFISDNQSDFIHLFIRLLRRISKTPVNVKPKGGGRADPGEFDVFMEARVKFPTPPPHPPRHLLNVNFPPLG